MTSEKKIRALIDQENEHIHKLHKIVTDTIQEEQLIVNNLLHAPRETLTKGQLISDKVARFGGSWNFVIVFIIVILLWIATNTIALINIGFDPYPFIFMNLVLSFIAALQAPIIMMSQNRQEEKDRMRSENDYLVNLKAEMEIRSLHQKMDLLLEEQIKTLYETQSLQFEMLKEVNEKLTQIVPSTKDPGAAKLTK